MADFLGVIQRTVDGLSDNVPEMREKIYEKARGAVRRQLESMKPRPSDEMIERQMGKLEAAIKEVEEGIAEPSITLSGNLVLSGSQSGVDLDVLPTLPAPQLGPSFGVTEDGHVTIVPANFVTDTDMREIGDLLSYLVVMADDLLALTVGSNSHQHLHQIAKQYRLALGTEGARPSVDRLYFQGIRIQNSAKHVRDQIASGDYPEMSLAISETVDSLIAMHGPLIMSTETGRNLVRKAKDYSYDPDFEEQYKNIALALTEKILAHDILDEASAEQIKATNEGINDGPDPRMSTEAAHATNANLLNKFAKIVLLGGGAMVGGAIAQSSFATAPSEAITSALNHIWTFIVSNPKHLLDLAALSAADLSWVPSFLRWAEINRVQEGVTSAMKEVLES